jgi:PLP dependent protein
MTAATSVDIRESVRAVQQRVEIACGRAGRDPAEVTIVAASKTMPPTALAAALDAGITDLGENRVQEALPKIEALGRRIPQPKWHFIGHLQRNKARQAAAAFDVIHSVDSEALLTALDRAASRAIECFIQVNVAGDESKFGVDPGEAEALLRIADGCKHITVTGLMTIGRLVAEPDQARIVFRELRAMAASLGLPKLSMGMTNDYEVAIEEGATHVRIGRAIFGEREP